MTTAFDADRDLCLGFFKQTWENGNIPPLPQCARVLELGCAEANWLAQMRAHRPDLHLTGIDWRNEPRTAADRWIQADALVHNFERDEFDAIVAVSFVAWCGVGHYTDPRDANGDTKILQRAHWWLKPSGWMYFDVAYTPSTETLTQQQGFMRRYSDTAIWSRLLRTQWSWRSREIFSGDGHMDGPYVACVVTPK